VIYYHPIIYERCKYIEKKILVWRGDIHDAITAQKTKYIIEVIPPVFTWKECWNILFQKKLNQYVMVNNKSKQVKLVEYDQLIWWSLPTMLQIPVEYTTKSYNIIMKCSGYKKSINAKNGLNLMYLFYKAVQLGGGNERAVPMKLSAGTLTKLDITWKTICEAEGYTFIPSQSDLKIEWEFNHLHKQLYIN
jgi:hypothetical protein